ncbi:MAG: hypothetical protein ACRC33_19345 [Gemmataceae bacterium]
MTDYQIQAPALRCSGTGRDLKPGERIFSVLLLDGGKFVRRDYAKEAWSGPPAGAFSSWQAKVPTGQKPKKPPIDDEVLVECLGRLEDDPTPEKMSFRYVLALLLMRRKRLRLEETGKETGREVMRLRCPKTGTVYAVTDPGLSDGELEAAQDDVFRVLGWD